MKRFVTALAAAAVLAVAVGIAPASAGEKLRIGVEGAYPPFSWKEADGTLMGFDIEIAMKWYIIQDSVTMNRADGGMVRLTTLLDGAQSVGDTRLQAFMTSIWPILPRFLPP